MPDPLPEITAEELTARVLTWQHRHPLARRLRAADVQSIGHVAVPFVDPTAPPPEPAGGSLRERALARAQASAAPGEAAAPAGAAAERPLRAAFDEDLLTPLAPAAVAAWALAHGVQRPREPLGLPVRRLPVRPGTPGVSWRWLLTAELRDGTARTRVLLGPAAGAPVLGRRLWSPVRLGLLGGLCGALMAGTVVMLLRPAAPSVAGDGPAMASGAGPAPGAPAASAASAAVAAAPAVPLPTAPAPALPAPLSSAPAAATQASPVSAASAPSSVPSSAPSPAPAPAPTSASPAPLDVEPRQGRVELPSLGPRIEERRRRAAEQQAAAAAAAASAAAPAPQPPPAVAAAVAGSPAFALGTRVLRTRAESQQIAEALRSLLVVPGSPVLQVDVLPVGDDFRVVAWPYPGREAAERAAAGLAARGHRVQVIEF